MKSFKGDQSNSDEVKLGNNTQIDAASSILEQEQDGNKDDIETYRTELDRLREKGGQQRTDENQPSLPFRPDWFNAALFENAKTVYARHFMGMNFAHLGGLLLLVRINSIYRTLNLTGKSDSVTKLFRRYYHTVVHVKEWYEGDIFEVGSDAYRSLLLVRGMHNKVSSEFNDADGTLEEQDSKETDRLTKREDYSYSGTNSSLQDANGNACGPKQVHISQYDIMLTQFAFLVFIVTRSKNVGLINEFDQYDLESMLHFWRVIGYYLGAREEFNLCSRKADETVRLCNVIMEFELKTSIRENNLSTPPAMMSLNIVRAVKFIPMLTFYGITRYLFELLDLDTSELMSSPTGYSRLSYTLIKLVMSRLLAYRPFRWFNNGLTRLSIFCVGKVENWFANHLQAKYGDKLRI